MIAYGVMLPKIRFSLFGGLPIIAGLRLLFFMLYERKYRKVVRVETENFVIVCRYLLFCVYLYHSL